VSRTVATPVGERFRLAITGILGLALEDVRPTELEELLARRLRATRMTAGDYLALLEAGPGRAETDALARAVTVAETYFFRHGAQFRALTEAALPACLRANAATKTVRVLSAGCASGEEAYSLAVHLRGARPDPTWDLSVLALDVSSASLARAAAGRYSRWSLRETPPELRRRWFRIDGNEVVLDESLRADVTFEQANLVEPDPDRWRPETFDVVFCRNVLMYFTPQVCNDVVQRLVTSLRPGGFLFLGHAESLRAREHGLRLQQSHGTFYYQRDDAVRRARPPVPAVPAFGRPAPVEPPDESWADAIHRSAVRIRQLADRPSGVLPTPVADLRPALGLLATERYAEALDLVADLPAEDDVLLLRAVLLTHSGQLGPAGDVARSLLGRGRADADAHHVLALCAEEAGDLAAAADEDRRAILLDPAFAMPRLHLGLLARRTGDHRTMGRELRYAMALLHREDPTRVLLFGGGFGRAALVELCRGALRADRTVS
jgi:chemotaxis protein methyltransferase CheR